MFPINRGEKCHWHKERTKFPRDRNVIVWEHQYGRRDVMTRGNAVFNLDPRLSLMSLGSSLRFALVHS